MKKNKMASSRSAPQLTSTAIAGRGTQDQTNGKLLWQRETPFAGPASGRGIFARRFKYPIGCFGQ